MKTSLLLLSLLFSVGMVYAQSEPAASAAPVAEQSAGYNDANAADNVVAATGQTETQMSARDAINQFLEEKGWAVGFNEDRNCFIATGFGELTLGPESDDYMDERLEAYEKAFLSAKEQMSRYMNVSVSTATSRHTTQRPKPPKKTVEEKLAEANATVLDASLEKGGDQLANAPKESVIGKAIRLIDAKLDNALKAEGINPDEERAKIDAAYKAAYDAQEKNTADAQKKWEEAEAAREALQKRVDSIKATDEFKSEVSTVTSSIIAGFQVYHVVESWDQQKKSGSIGVVAIWSPLLSEMAASMVTGEQVRQMKPKKPIIQQIPKNHGSLESSFGVMQLINEKGNLVLVAYGQGVIEDETDEFDISLAQEEAEQNALKAIREFAGEAFSSESKRTTLTKRTTFRDGSPAEKSIQKASQHDIETAAAALGINGVSNIYRKQLTHSLSGKAMFVGVYTWSPKSATNARKMMNTVEETGRRGAAGQRSVPTGEGRFGRPGGGSARRPASANRSYLNSGATGDDDAF